MHIALVDSRLIGHHEQYLTSLSSGLVKQLPEATISLLVPRTIPNHKAKQFIIPEFDMGEFDLRAYRGWMNELAHITAEIKPDMLHFLCGDALYKYFSYRMSSLPCQIKIATFHHVRRSLLRDCSFKCIASNLDAMVVHTEALANQLRARGLMNVRHIDYPRMDSIDTECDSKKCRAYFGIPEGKCVLLALGEIRHDKGIDILLDTLPQLKNDFHLLIAGRLVDYEEKYIRNKIRSVQNSVTLRIGLLSDEEFCKAINACDYMVLPYRRSFDGASGPMTEGIWRKKLIVAPDHGSLGSIVSQNSLGKTFKCEDPIALAAVLDEMLSKRPMWNDKAESYRKQLSPDKFISAHVKMYHDLHRMRARDE